MSAAVQQTIIGTPRGSLPQCTPNLMPFHIAYSGSAPISTYFRVRPAPVPSSGHVSGEETPENTGTETPPSLGDVQSASASSQATLVASSSAATLSSTTEVSDGTPSDPQTSEQVRDAATGLSHLIAAFRGRTVRGLTVNLPTGYAGLVLRTPDDRKRTDDMRNREMEKAREKGRKAARRKTGGSAHVPDVEPEEDVDMGRGDETDEQTEETPLRVLDPVATFSSFVLWNPDLAVDEGRDEYLRALTEWTTLAAEIHRCEE